MTAFLISDAYLGGICNAETPSGCLDGNAGCNDSICQCVVEFSDINGTCKAGKPASNDAAIRLPCRSVFLFVPCIFKQMRTKNKEETETYVFNKLELIQDFYISAHGSKTALLLQLLCFYVGYYKCFIVLVLLFLIFSSVIAWQ